MADTKAAAMNFLNALERIPQIVEQYKAKNETHETNLPVLQEVSGKTWRKEDELKELKTELAALDRKIQLELAPPTQETGQEQTNKEDDTAITTSVTNGSNQFINDDVIIDRPKFPVHETTKGFKI